VISASKSPNCLSQLGLYSEVVELHDKVKKTAVILNDDFEKSPQGFSKE